jgi:hypothetical protein
MTRKRLVVVCAVAIAMLGRFASSAAAQNPFVIDGSVPANGTISGPLQTADPFGSVRELGPVNSSATKVGVIHSAVPPMLSFTNPNGQVDLRNIWTQSTKSADGHIWFYFAWERDANTGSGFIAYEFQQASLSPSCAYTAADIDMILPQSAAETTLINSCNPWQNRQAGDFLIMWDQSGSALNIFKRVFALSGGQLVLGPSQPLGTAVAAISPDGFRGEAAIDLTVDVFPPDGACFNVANIIPGTVTGNSDTADYKDTVLSQFPPISSCGIVTVTKVTTPAGLSGNFPYTLARSDGSQIRHDGTLQINQLLTHDGDSTGSPILDLISGTNYSLTEGAQVSPWELVSISCTTDAQPPVDLTSGGTFNVDANTLTACTITNRLKRGTLIVIKHVVNDNGGTAVPSDFMISLGDSANTVFAGATDPGTTFQFDAGYAFNVNEIVLPAGYALLSLSGDCAGTIEADVTKVCIVTNDDTKAAPEAATAMSWVLHDSATVSGIRPGAPDAGSATITFRLYGPNDASCSTAIKTEVRPAGAGSASTVTGHTIGQAQVGTYRWIASYSGDQFNLPVSTACGAETHTITIP